MSEKRPRLLTELNPDDWQPSDVLLAMGLLRLLAQREHEHEHERTDIVEAVESLRRDTGGKTP